MESHKIVNLKDFFTNDLKKYLTDKLGRIRYRGYNKVVLCHGVFDLFHIGHLHHLNEAKRYGDILVVSITSDRFVNKGPNRPVFNENQRTEMLAGLECVDFVVINDAETAIEAIKTIRPDFYIKGSDYQKEDITGNFIFEKEAVESVGGEVIFTEGETFSSSTIINDNFSNLSEEANDFLREFRKKYTIEEVLQYLDEVDSLKVLVIGEAITDEYHYCKTLGKSGKEPILALQAKYKETFFGGSWAIRNNVFQFSPHVEKTHLSPIEEEIVKLRYVEEYPFQKMFEVYSPIKFDHTSKESKEYKEWLKDIINDYDLVIVADYGHGMIDKEIVEIIRECKASSTLAINTQSNADNYGFNTISKYKWADYICLSESEIRLEERQKTQSIEEIIKNVSNKLDCDLLTVTQGNKGLITYDRRIDTFHRVPAFTNKVVDRIGAGDAVFAITSLLATKDTPSSIIAMVGSAVGAMAVDIVCNKEPINKIKLKKFITTLMK